MYLYLFLYFYSSYVLVLLSYTYAHIMCLEILRSNMLFHLMSAKDFFTAILVFITNFKSKFKIKFQASFTNEFNSGYLKENCLGGLQTVNPSDRGGIARFDSCHWSRDSSRNITSDDAWLCWLRALQSHSISCFKLI